MTIHYEGRLRDVELIDELIEELSHVAGRVGWSSELIDDDGLRGVVLLVHEDCEPLTLLFDRKGVLRFPSEELDEESGHVFVETQRAPVDVHIAIVTLLEHLRERYFTQLDVEDDSGYWGTGTRQAFVKHHSCVSILTDRFAATPENVIRSAGGVDTEDLVERLQEALREVTSGYPRTEEDVCLDSDRMDAAFPEPLPPDRDVLLTWHVDDWIDYFERHDRSRNSFLGFMSGRAETEDEFAMALSRVDEEEALSERRASRLISEWEREIGEERRRDLDAEDDSSPEPAEPAEPWRASLPEFPPRRPCRSDAREGRSASGDAPDEPSETLTRHCLRASDDWDEIAAECPAFDAALELMGSMAAHDREGESGSPMLRFVKGSISTTIIGVSMGHAHWSRSEGFPLARTARYIIAARRFAQIARLLARLPEPELRDMASRAGRIASGFRSAAEESPGGRSHEW